MIRARVQFAIIAAAATHAALAEAQSPDLSTLKHLSLEQIMEVEVPTVYGASKHQQKVTEAPASVSVITRDDIRVYGHRTIADVLRSTRGFYVTSDRSGNNVGVRGFNRPGDFGGRILYLVDGHRMNEVAHDSLDVGTHFPVDIDMVDRVEVIRGPGSVLYGNNAFFGVVNVVTRKAASLNGLEVSGEAGSFDTYKGRASYGKVFSNGASLTLSGSALDSRGDDLYEPAFDSPVTNHGIATGKDHDRVYSALGTFTWSGFTLQSTYLRAEQGVPTGSYGAIYNRPYITEEERSSTRLSYDHTFGGDLSLHASAYWNSYRNDVSFPRSGLSASGPRNVVFRDTTKAEWWGVDFDLSKLLFDRHRVTIGADYRDTSKLEFASRDLDPEYTFFGLSTSSTTAGAFIQDEWKITSKLTLNAGLSYDWFDTSGGTVCPRGALIYQATEKTTLKLLYGEAFRAPTVFESQYAIPSNAARQGLEPEQIRTVELILEQSLAKSTRATATVFHNDISDLISVNTSANGSQYFYANSGDAKTTGGSFELESEFAKGIKGRASYTLQHTTDKETGARLSNSPEHIAKLNLTVPLLSEKVFGGLEVQYASESNSARGERVGGHVVTNLTLFGREILPGLDASFGIYNLFDTEYADPAGPEHRQSRIMQDGRSFRVKCTYRF